MKSARFPFVLCLVGLVAYACTSAAPAQPSGGQAATAGQSTAGQSTAPADSTPPVDPTAPATAAGSVTSAAPSAEAATPRSTPQPTTARLEVEIIQSHSWSDAQGNARAVVLLRNPYDFPVQVGSGGGRAILRDGAGEVVKSGELYFLDGISGGTGFLLPGETIGAQTCFTCEQALLTEEWETVDFDIAINDATGDRNYSTDVEASGVEVEFTPDSAIFDVQGKATNSSDAALDRISVRVFVFNEGGELIGAAENSGYDVAPGSTVDASGYGLGEAPAGGFDIEVSAVGIKY